MVLSRAATAPLVVVLGATGHQGGSVIKYLSETSERQYRFRALTRDASSAAAQHLAQQGVDVLQGDMATVDRQQLFKDAGYIFVKTMSKPGRTQEEYDLGVGLIDAAKEVNTLKLFIWSAVQSPKRITQSSSPVDIFDVKEDVSNYWHKSGIPFCTVQAAGFMQNFLAHFGPRKQDDGAFATTLPITADTKFALIDVDDYGLWVQQAIENPKYGPGSDVLACAEEPTLDTMNKTWSDITGHPWSIKTVTADVWRTRLPAPAAETYLNMLRFFHDYGYYGGLDFKPFLSDLAQKPTTWAEFVKKSDWSGIINGDKP